jgi:hypothetical protein
LIASRFVVHSPPIERDGANVDQSANERRTTKLVSG